MINGQVQDGNTVTIVRCCVSLVIVAAFSVGDSVPSEGFGTTAVVDWEGTDDSVGDDKRQVNDAVATARNRCTDLLGVGVGMVD